MNLQKEIESILKKSLGEMGIDGNVSVSFSNRPELCDYQSNACFALSKQLHKAPLELAGEIVANIPANRKFVFTAEKPGFINVKVKDTYLAKKGDELLEDELVGVEKHKKSKRIIMDYGGANVAKELHVGHLRSPIIGESLNRLHTLFGDNVTSDAHLGDWGLQMGLTIAQLMEDGVLDYYFKKTGKEPVITLDMLNEAYPKANRRKSVEPEFKEKAAEITLRIQRKESPYYEAYRKIREVSVAQIAKHYEELNAHFDLFLGESDAEPYISKAIDIFKKKGLAHESEGALIVDVAKEGENILSDKLDKDGKPYLLNPMPPVILKKSNGADVYATTDIATVLMRNKEKGVDEIIYVTDNRQGSHFERFFRACKLAGISPEKQKLTHIVFGTINGKDGKPFKTRSGETIKLADIINLLIEKASEKLKSNGLKPSRELALKIGVGAMKFGDLSNTVAKDYVFDIDKFLAFEGKTGPYLQYTVARINSILAKTDCEGGKIKIYSEDERRIILAIMKLISSYQICYDDNSLNMLCSATYDTASAFSTFYNNHRILGEKNLTKKRAYISICKLVRRALVQALSILAIDVPEKM